MATMSTVTEQSRFLELFGQHRRAIMKVCWAYGRTEHDRDDLFQEIVVRLWQAFAKYDGIRPFATWMYRVALNVAIDDRRRRARRRAASIDDAATSEPVAPDETSLCDLRDLLDSLDEGDRAILLLDLEGQCDHDIGDILGISASNVGTRRQRLKARLRSEEFRHSHGEQKS